MLSRTLVIWSLYLLPVAAMAQETVIQSPITEEILPLDPAQSEGFEFEDPNLRDLLAPIIREPDAQPASIADKGVMLRAVDKISGELVDFDLTPGQTKQLGYIQVTLGECRYPTDNPSGDSSAYLTVRNAKTEEVAFSGWMIASSPALNALDHARYDVWVLRCITS